MQTIVVIVVISASLLIAGFSYLRAKSLGKEARKKEEQVRHRMYELAILKEISDRIGYSLNVEKIVDIITASLEQFIPHSAASYMLLGPGKILFKVNLRKPVSPLFIDEVRGRMLDSLSALLEKDLSRVSVEATVVGVLTDEEAAESVNSFFNIPLVIGGNVVGVLTVADSAEGLYKEEEMTLLYKIVGQASRAVTRLEEVVKTEQRKLSAMVESMADGVVMIDKDYRVLVANPSAKRIVGFLAEEKPTIFDFIDALTGVFDIKGKLEEALKTGNTLAMDNVAVGERVFHILISPVSGHGTKKTELFGGVVIFHDITYEKELEQMKEDFISMMVHELRSPLDGIKKMSEFMGVDPAIREDEKRYREYIKLIHEGSSEILELVNDLLYVAKIESGKFDVDVELADIKDIIKQRIRFFETTAKDARIELTSLFDKNAKSEIRIDPLRISQALNNLISNALKFTKPGGSVVVQVLAHKQGQSIESEAQKVGIKWFLKDKEEKLKNYPDALFIAVTDTGEGISKSNMGKLFNKFKQFESVVRSGRRGTGLGLVIAKGIIKAHGGIIGVDSEEGTGSTFYFILKS
ncbi:MAG: hypothetical protein BMS9Abin13_116 [Patescibacteria group bacterium]|nr:MAG: hypothetical protein BMS9Abin13_116 [Patescibacteria group bacterium]